MNASISRESQRRVDASTNNKVHYAFLDALRGWAILGVITSHFCHDFQVGVPAVLKFIGNGVSLFYVLSAYCLFLSLSQNCSPNWRAYALRRLFRIAPAFYAAVIVWSLFWLITGRQAVNPMEIMLSVLFVNGFFPDYLHSAIPHGWSIAIETNFYVLLPLLFLGIKTVRSSILAFLIITPITLSISWIITRLWPESGAYTLYWLPSQLPVFLLGILSYNLVANSSPQIVTWRKKLMSSWLTPIIALGGASGSAAILPTRISLVAVSLSFSIFLVWLAFNKNIILVNRFICKLGVISFSAYLFHNFPLMAFREILKILQQSTSFHHLYIYTIGSLFGVVASTCIIAYLSFRFIERPGVRVGNLLIKRLFERERLSLNAHNEG